MRLLNILLLLLLAFFVIAVACNGDSQAASRRVMVGYGGGYNYGYRGYPSYVTPTYYYARPVSYATTVPDAVRDEIRRVIREELKQALTQPPTQSPAMPLAPEK